jgi:hypothetical protein
VKFIRSHAVRFNIGNSVLRVGGPYLWEISTSITDHRSYGIGVFFEKYHEFQN